MQYDDMLKLLAVVKSDDAYIERLEELKKQQMELAYAKEIATTVSDAEKYRISAKQDAEYILSEAQKKADEIVKDAEAYVEKQREETRRKQVITQKAKELQVEYDKKLAEMLDRENEVARLKQELDDRMVRVSKEIELTKQIRKSYEDKFKLIVNIINQ